jgi:hypothetical protein
MVIDLVSLSSSYKLQQEEALQKEEAKQAFLKNK